MISICNSLRYQCIVALLLLSEQCFAGGLPVGGSASWVSDYVVYGVSQTFNKPAIQADLHVRPNNEWSTGIWASTVHVSPNTTSTELSFILNHLWTINQDLNIVASGARYQYLDSSHITTYNYDEISLALHWADTLYARVAWSPDYELRYPIYVLKNQQILTMEGGYHYPFPYLIDLQVGLGYYAPLSQSDGRYAYGSAGISRHFGSFHIEVNYFWMQAEHRMFSPWPAASPWVASLSWRF